VLPNTHGATFTLVPYPNRTNHPNQGVIIIANKHLARLGVGQGCPPLGFKPLTQCHNRGPRSKHPQRRQHPQRRLRPNPT